MSLIFRLPNGLSEEQTPKKCSLLRYRENEASSSKESVPSFSLSLFFLISESPSVIISENESIEGHFVASGQGSSDRVFAQHAWCHEFDSQHGKKKCGLTLQ